MMENATQLHDKTGPAFDRWAQAMFRYVDSIAPGGVAPTKPLD
jgi:hypothetical protein